MIFVENIYYMLYALQSISDSTLSMCIHINLCNHNFIANNKEGNVGHMYLLICCSGNDWQYLPNVNRVREHKNATISFQHIRLQMEIQ